MRRNAESRFLRSKSLVLTLALFLFPALATGGSSAGAAPGTDAAAEGAGGRGSWAGLPTIIGTPTAQATEMTFSSSLGRMVLFGGSEGDDTLTYDLMESTFRNAPTYSAPPARTQHGFVTDETSGRIVLFGGASSYGRYRGDTWTYDAVAGNWENNTPAGSPEGRASHAMSYAGSGRVLLFSGVTSPQGTGSADTWVYDVAKNRWLQLAPTLSPPPRGDAAITWLDGDRVLLFGGFSVETPYQNWLNDAWVFDLARLEWKEVTPPTGPGPLSQPRLLFDETSSKVLLLGATNFYPTQIDVWTVSLDALQWTRSVSASGQLSLQQFAAAVSDDGTVVAIGLAQSYPSYMTEIWHLHPTTMSWQQMPTDFSPASCPWPAVGFHRERESPYMVGFCNDGQSRMFEYSRGTQAWVPLQSSPPAGSMTGGPPMSAALEDGILIYNGGPEHETWRFSSASGRWNRWTSISGPETFYGAVLAAAGNEKLLMFGGYTQTGTMPDQTWIYDLGSNSWSEASSSPRPPGRTWAGATHDDRSGRVIMFGGFDTLQPSLLHMLGDTWAFDVRSEKWTEVSTATAPPPRFVPTIAQMGPGGPVALFGGLDETQNAFGDTWHFDGYSWKLMDPIQSPRPRGLGRAVWDPVVERLLMYGGFSGGGWSTETWHYSIRTPRVVATTPSSGDQSATRDTRIRVEFDMPMEFAKMLSLVSLVPAITGATGKGTGTVFEITHSELLQPGTTYQVSISPRVISTDGLPMGEWYNFSFRTAAGGTITAEDVLRALPWALLVAGVVLTAGAVVWRSRKGKTIRTRPQDTRRTLDEPARSVRGRQIGGAAALARKRAAVRRVAERARLRAGR